jgi:hypothetical protein
MQGGRRRAGIPFGAVLSLLTPQRWRVKGGLQGFHRVLRFLGCWRNDYGETGDHQDPSELDGGHRALLCDEEERPYDDRKDDGTEV